MHLENHILGSRSIRLPARKLDTVVTVMMLLPSVKDKGLGLDGLRAGRYRLDTELVTALLDSTRDSLTKWIVVRSAAFPFLPPHLFRRLFFRFWPSRRTDAWRWALGNSLSAFLSSNPGETRHYVRVIWKMARDENEDVALRGLNCARFLGDALTLSRAKQLVALSHHPSVRASQALSILSDLYRGLRKLRPEVRAFLLSPATISTLRKAPSPDGRGKWSAYGFCMEGIRKALPRSRRGPRLRVVK